MPKTMHDLGLKTSIKTFDAFIRCTLMGNQPWPQFQSGIRERSIGTIRLRLMICSFTNQEPSCFDRYLKNIHTVPIRSVVPIIHSCSIKSLVCKINFKVLLPANLRCTCADCVYSICQSFLTFVVSVN